MANEIWHNYLTSKNLYACIFNISGNVYYIVGDAFEAWGNGSRDADDYDITLAETNPANSMHYVGTFPSAIDAGVYRVTVYDRATGTPIDSDIAIGQGEMHWDGTAEMNISTLDITLDAILVADRTAVIVTNETGTGGGGSIPIITTTDPAIP